MIGKMRYGTIPLVVLTLLLLSCSVNNKGTGEWGFKMTTSWSLYQDVDNEIDNEFKFEPAISEWLFTTTENAENKTEGD